NKKVNFLFFALFSISGYSQPSFSQEEVSLLVEVGPCLNLESTLDRFACYEKQVDLAKENSESINSTSNLSLNSAETEVQLPTLATRQEYEDSFGLPEEPKDPDESESLESTITNLRETLPNYWIITLENGQVWRQMNGKIYPLVKGQEIRIYP